MFKKIFLSKLTSVVETLALQAVEFVEKQYNSQKGEEKKKLAVDFILVKLPLWLLPFKPFIASTLLELIDISVEKALLILKSRLV